MALRLRGSTSGYAEIDAPAVAGDVTLTLPSTTGTINVKDASGNTEVGTGVTFGNPGANIFTVNNTGGERLRIAADGTVSIPGALNVSGVLTYEDVTSVDAIGLSTFRDGLNTKDVGITTISTSVSDTAADVFIYDTTKDSDGGEWRKRTSHTSWYNETLNTATRGSRKEFPAVAVIVAEADKVTIYDGDDPDLPMWMIVTGSNNDYAIETEATSIFALNGVLSIGCGGSGFDLYLVKFLEDAAYEYSTGGYRKFVDNIATRSSSTRVSVDLTLQIIDRKINDVAMTVLPNAPIDDATGLPVPTIAVATDGGVSVIKDDGTVADITATSYDYTSSISFTEDNELIFSWDSNTRGRFIHVYDIPGSDVSHGGVGYQYGAGKRFYTNYAPSSKDLEIWNNTSTSWETKDVLSNGIGHTQGLTLLDENPTSPANGMVAFATTSYNTGYLHGDIKGAFLSGISTASLVATDLDIVTNGSFAADSDWTKGTGWTISGGTATHTGSGGDFNQQIAVVTGRKYLMTVTVDLTGDSSIVNTSIGLRTLANDSYYVSKSSSWTANAVNTVALYWTSTVTGNILARCYSEDDVSLDNWVVQDVTDGNSDRSVNNKGLQVFGTITKSAVATGADLVAYSNFSTSNYLQQSYNSDLDFGTDDFSITCWFKPGGSVAAADTLLYRGIEGETGGRILLAYLPVTNPGISFYANSGSWGNQADTGAALQNNIWHHIVAQRKGNVLQIYVNGVLSATQSNSENITNTSAFTRIGYRTSTSAQTLVGDLSLFRISASAPSAEQIKKMYNDEKVLFQENAKATLYGSSDAVTALAYDEITDQLHVGTSSGRSDFQGLRRINNTTQEVQTAISAHDTFIVEQ